MSLGMTSIRLNLGASSAFAIVVLIGVCIGLLRVLTQQEAVMQQIEAHDLARTEMVGTLLRQISENQRMPSETLTAAAARELKQEDVFRRGREAIDFVRTAEGQFAGLKPLFANGDAISLISCVNPCGCCGQHSPRQFRSTNGSARCPQYRATPISSTKWSSI
jgi:hypothetical protein